MTEHDDPTDADLIAASRRGDRSAYAQLWQRHQAAGMRVARSSTRLTDPDDLVSEAFLVILRALQGGRGPTEAFRPYLFAVIRNLARRAATTRRTVSGDVDLDLIAADLDLEADHEDGVDRDLVGRAFRTLPDRWQAVLWSTEVDGRTAAEIAPALGMTPNATAALAYRAREGLRQAWLQAHIDAARAGSACSDTLAHLGEHVRGALGKRASGRVDAHLMGCDSCRDTAFELQQIGGRLSVLLVGAGIALPAASAIGGATAGGGATAASVFGGAAAPGSAVVATGVTTGGTGGLIGAVAIAGALTIGGGFALGATAAADAGRPVAVASEAAVVVQASGGATPELGTVDAVHVDPVVDTVDGPPPAIDTGGEVTTEIVVDGETPGGGDVVTVEAPVGDSGGGGGLVSGITGLVDGVTTTVVEVLDGALDLVGDTVTVVTDVLDDIIGGLLDGGLLGGATDDAVDVDVSVGDGKVTTKIQLGGSGGGADEGSGSGSSGGKGSGDGSKGSGGGSGGSGSGSGGSDGSGGSGGSGGGKGSGDGSGGGGTGVGVSTGDGGTEVEVDLPGDDLDVGVGLGDDGVSVGVGDGVSVGIGDDGIHIGLGPIKIGIGG